MEEQLIDITALLAGPDETWMDLALCAQSDPEAFFPEKGGSTRAAKAVCEDCEVRAECLDYAIAHDEAFGIWGGLSNHERRDLKAQILTSSTPTPVPTSVPTSAPTGSRTAAEAPPSAPKAVRNHHEKGTAA